MMLERQIVVTGDHLSVFCDVVMALPPLLQPYFRWHSMLMPVLPLSLDAFLDAPVPFFAGVPKGHPATVGGEGYEHLYVFEVAPPTGFGDGAGAYTMW